MRSRWGLIGLLALTACQERERMPAPGQAAAAAQPAPPAPRREPLPVTFADPHGRYTARFPAAPKVEKNVATGRP